jgi:hypothetical protein
VPKIIKWTIDILLAALWVAILAGRWLDVLSAYFPLITVVIAGYLTWEHVLERESVKLFLSRRVRRYKTMTYTLVFLACGLLGIVYLSGANRLTDRLNAAQEKKTPPPAVALYVACTPTPLPTGLAPSSTARIMFLHPGSEPLDDMLHTVVSAQDKMRVFPEPTEADPVETGHPWDRELFRFQIAFRCEISNHGPSMVHDINISMPVAFFREDDIRYRDKEGTGSDSGPVFGPPKGPPVHQITRTVNIQPLDSGRSFTFLIINTCSQFVSVFSTPSVADVQVFGDSSRRQLNLEHDDRNIFGPQIQLPVSSLKWKGVRPCE